MINDLDIDLILSQYSYRSGHAMTTTEVLKAKDDTRREIIMLLKPAVDVVRGLKAGRECFCDMAIGHPNCKEHTPACAAASTLLAEADKAGI